MALQWTLDRRTTIGIGMALMLFIVVVILSALTIAEFRIEARSVAHTHYTLEQLAEVQSLVFSAESEVRGFVLTGAPDYLVLQPDLRDSVRKVLTTLDSLLAAAPARLAELDRLRRAFERRAARFQRTVDAYYERGSAPALTLARSEDAKILSDSIKAMVGRLQRAERVALLQREAESESQARQMTVILASGTAVSLLIFLSILYALNRQTLARNAADELVRRSEARLVSFLEFVPAGIFILKADGSPYFANEAATQILGKGILPGISPDQLTEQYQAYRAGSDEQYPSNELPVVRALAGERTTISDIEVTRDGKRIPLLVTGAPIYSDTGELQFALAAFIDISVQKEIEARLTESERRYRQIIEQATDVIYRTDRRGYFTFVNETGLRLFGYTEKEIDGLHYLDVVRPDMKERVRRFYLRQALEKGKSTYLEFPVITKQGKQLYLGQNVAMLLQGDAVEGFQAVARDVTERLEAREALERREQQLSTVIETVDEGITFSDERGYFEIFNHRMEELTGYFRDEANQSRDFSALIATSSTEHQAGLDRLKTVLAEGRIRDVETTIRAKNGGLRTVLVSTTLVQQGTRRMFLSVYRDITQQKDYLRQLEEATKAANAAAKAKAEFLATMSHEIRTPMNGVIGMTDVLLHTDLTGEQHEYVDTIRTSGETLLTIINDILDFSKIESGKLVLDERKFDLTTCIEDVYDLLSFKAREKNIDLLYLIDPGIPRSVVGDDIRLRQILLNLVGNAVKFTPAGEVFTKVSLREGRNGHLTLRFDVIDTGIGIPRTAQDRLFQAFTQADSSTTRRFGGTGLGLAISQRLVELMHGRISVQSREGKGSTFTFTVRMRQADDTADSPTLYVVSRSEPLTGKSILIVDDNRTNLEVLRLQTSRWGMRPTVVDRPEAAIDLLRNGSSFHIAVLDFQMAEMDGVELARELRAIPSAASMPMLLLSSQEHQAELSRSDPNLFAGSVMKPLKELQLLDLLSSTLTGRTVSSRRKSQKADALLSASLPLRILVAEDNAVNQKLVLRMLQKLGYDADIASTGVEAVASASSNPYDIVLMDVNMPEMDGLEATRHILADTSGRPLPRVLALTAGVLDEDKQKCREAGMDDFLTKPIHLDELRKALRKWGSTRTAPAGNTGAASAADIEPDMARRLDVLSREIDKPFVRDLIRDFIPDTEQKLQKLQDAVRDGDIRSVRQISHGLKGSTLNLGATRLGNIFESLQACVDNGELDRLGPLIDEAMQAWTRTRRGLEQYAQSLPATPAI